MNKQHETIQMTSTQKLGQTSMSGSVFRSAEGHASVSSILIFLIKKWNKIAWNDSKI